MDKIEVKILDHNLNGMAKFLARLTQRGHLINSMADIERLYEESLHTPPSEYLLKLPHSTIKRMNYLTIAITGLSTKCVSQLRTHATRLTFVSTSTQYSSYENRQDNFVLPEGLSENHGKLMKEAYRNIENEYAKLLTLGVDKDKAGYLLPQGLRKALIISGNLDAWQYVISLRLCNRNTKETQHVMRLIYNAIEKECGPEYVVGMLPPCVKGECKEGKFCCGKRFEL
jgi:thymidylate synthase (FAD)